MKEEEKEGQAEMEEWKWRLGGGKAVNGNPGWTKLQCWFLDLAHPPAGYRSLEGEDPQASVVYKFQRVYVKIRVDLGSVPRDWSAATGAGLYPGTSRVSCPSLLGDQGSRQH